MVMGEVPFYLEGRDMLKRLFLLTTVLVPLSMFGQRAGDVAKKSALPDFDLRESNGSSEAKEIVSRRTVAMRSSLAAEQAVRPGTRITAGKHGLPKTMLRDGGVLSAPSAGDAIDTARNFLRSKTEFFPFASREVDQLRLTFRDSNNGATHLAFQQTIDGYDVFEGQIKFLLNRAGEVVQVSTSEAVPGLTLRASKTISADAAVARAKQFVKGKVRGPLVRQPELVVFPLDAATARLAYRIFLDEESRGYFEILVDASSGGMLYRHNLRKDAQARVWTESPVIGTRQLVTLPAGWLSGNATTGNNTDTYLDANGNDSPDAVTTAELQNGRAFSATQTFDFAFGDGTTGQDPAGFQAASVTNLFYLVNTAHDYYYGLGFNEAAANFQTNNNALGGIGGDAVIAAAQNLTEQNNASFETMPEGTPPRMRMGLFTQGTGTKTDDRDSAYDGNVVLHEYAHGVSTRLVGGGTNTSCLNRIQSGALGEGWSDYFSNSFFNNPIVAAYSANDPLGLRRFSYEGYPYTYEDLGNEGYEVHNDGEIWAATLWDLRKAVGQSVSDRLVMNGLKGTPCNPSMINARDAILSADQAANAGANRTAIWTAFAKHGMGFSARGVEGTSRTGTIYDAAYDVPTGLPGATPNPAITSNPLTNVPSSGQPYSSTIVATNPGAGTLNYALNVGPLGLSVGLSSGAVQWTPGFTGGRVKVTVTDGKGGKVVHGFLLPVFSHLSLGNGLTIAGPENSTGSADVVVPSNVAVLQVTLRGGSGDGDLYVLDPDGNWEFSERGGNSETLSFASPKAGTWIIEVDGYFDYSGVILQASSVTPQTITSNTSVPGLGAPLSDERLYKVTLPSGLPSFTVATTGGSGDVDLYVRRNAPALCQASSNVSTLCLADQVSAQDGNEESIRIDNPVAGDYYIDMSAFAAYSGVTLKTSLGAPVETTPTTLTFDAIISGAAPGSQPIAITIAAGGPQGWTAAATTTTGGPWLQISATSGTGNSTLNASVVITGLALGTYQGKVTISGANGGSAVVNITLNVLTPGPLISPGGIVGAGASSVAVTRISPNGFASIYGSNFAAPGTFRSLLPSDLIAGKLPTKLGTVCVDADGLPAFLTFVSEGQVNILVPSVRTGVSVPVVVKTNCGTGNETASPAVNVLAQSATPEFLHWAAPSDNKFPVIAVNALTGAYVGPPGVRPGATFVNAKPDDYLTIYAVGFGPTNPAVTPGSPATVRSDTVATPVVQLGGTTLATSDVLYAGASPGTPGLYQLNIHIPSNTPSGNYALVLGLGGNTTPTSYLQVQSGPAPDLVVSSLTAPLSGTSGSPLAGVQSVISNQGNAAAGAFRVGFYLSPTQVVTTSSTFAGLSCQVAALGIGATSNCSGSLTIPASLSAGTYYLGAIADDQTQITEGSELNNVLIATSGPISITAPPQADLLVTALTAPTTGTQGGNLAGVQATIRNQGTAAAGAFRIGFYLSTTTAITTASTFTGFSCNVASLATGTNTNCAGTVSIPPGLANGTYYLGAIVDDQTSVTESNEANNLRLSDSGVIAIGIAGTPDLIITALTSPNSGSAGGTLAGVNMTVRNQGSAAAPTFRVGFYLSTSPTFSPAATYTTTFCHFPSGLAPATNGSCTTSVAIPPSLSSGTYFLFAVADDQSQLTESNENNNALVSGSGAIIITSTTPSINVGQTVNGTLSAAAGRSATCSGCYADTYQLVLAAPATVTINLNSSAFDPWLTLLTVGGTVIIEDDDSGPGLNSTIVMSLSAGIYKIEATSAFEGDTGPYTLSVN